MRIFSGMLVSLGLFSVFGCASVAPAPQVATPGPVEAEPPAPELSGEGRKNSVALSSEELALHKVGERYVQRFVKSGSEVWELEEQVMARRASSYIVEYSLRSEDADGRLAEVNRFRVEVASATEAVVFARKWEGGRWTSSTVAEFAAALSVVSVVPEANRGELAAKEQTCLVGDDEFTCQMKRYEVRVGDEQAFLQTERSEGLARPVRGEIVALDGTVLYHSELIEYEAGDALPTATPKGTAFNDRLDFEQRD